ncbi:UNVERIFIED_CONTAM: hypothetical protein NCL1_00790 [Trichonephila clavipes]
MPQGAYPSAGTLWNHDGQLPALRFRRKLLPVDQRHRSGAGKDAGLDHAGLVVHADCLSDFHSAGYPQGGARRVCFRHLDLGHDHRGLCDSGLPVRHPAAGAVRGRLLLAVVSAQGPHLGRLEPDEPLGQDHGLPVAYRAARHRLHHLQLCHADAVDEEQLSG